MQDNEKNRTSRNRKKRIMRLCMLIYVLLAAALDILIRITSIPYWVVSETYIDVVFAALCTVAVLGSAIQSIIIGSFNSKIYGLTTKEVLAEIPDRINISKTLIASFLSIIVGLIFFALGFCSTTTAIAVCIVIIISISSIKIWRLLSNDETQLSVINEIIDSNNLSPEYFYVRWFPELKNAIENNDEVSLDAYVKLINRINSNGKGTPFIENKIKDIFPLAALHIGFVDTYKKIVCLGEWQNKAIDAASIVQNYFLQIQYCNEQQIGQYRIPETVDDILERMEVSADEKLRFVYGLYTSLKNNQIISQRVRNTIISGIYAKLCYLRDTEISVLRKKIILYIFKRDILVNENVAERKELMQMLNACLFHNNIYSRDDCYISLLAQLFRALYFYSFFETETLNSDYRNELSALFQYGEIRRDNFRITLAGLISENAESIVAWLSDDCKTDSYHIDSMFEYFSADFVAKNSVWTVENCLTFAFEYYLLVGYRFQLFPVVQLIENDGLDINHRIRLCNCIVNCFDHKGRLTEKSKSSLSQLRSFLGVSYSLEESLGSSNFEYYNGKLGELRQKHNAELVAEVSNDLTELNNKVTDKFSGFQGFKYCKTINLDQAHVISIRPMIRHAFEQDISFAADEKVWLIKDVLNHMVGDVLPKIQLSFDQNGVNTLLTELEKSDYKARNYTFVNDWALSKEVRASTEYERLVELLSTIPFIAGSDIHRHVFIKEEQIEFNAEVLSYRTEKPTDTQCEEYITSFKVADGKYQIDGAVLNFEKAIDYVKSAFIVEYSKICVATNLNSESGFAVVFSYRSKK